MPRRVALYGRVSTTDQHPDIQIHALRAYAAARGLELAEEHVYVDHGVSGARDRRPALDRLLADARRRRFDAVAVVKLDRLGRSLHHLLTLLGQLEELGVGFISLDDAIDTSTASGRLFMQMRGAFAEYELAMIRERTRAGLAAARRRGKRLGRPEAAVDRMVLVQGIRAGASVSELARRLGVARSTVRKQLQMAKNVSAANLNGEAIAAPGGF